MSDLKEKVERELSNKGIKADVKVNYSNPSYKINVTKNINEEKIRFTKNFAELLDTETEKYLMASSIVGAMYASLKSDVECFGNDFIVYPYDSAEIICKNCGNIYKFFEDKERPLDQETLVPALNKEDREQRIDNLSRRKREVLKLYLIGKMVDHNC